MLDLCEFLNLVDPTSLNKVLLSFIIPISNIFTD